MKLIARAMDTHRSPVQLRQQGQIQLLLLLVVPLVFLLLLLVPLLLSEGPLPRQYLIFLGIGGVLALLFVLAVAIHYRAVRHAAERLGLGWTRRRGGWRPSWKVGEVTVSLSTLSSKGMEDALDFRPAVHIQLWFPRRLNLGLRLDNEPARLGRPDLVLSEVSPSCAAFRFRLHPEDVRASLEQALHEPLRDLCSVLSSCRGWIRADDRGLEITLERPLRAGRIVLERSLGLWRVLAGCSDSKP